ncbi:MAG: AcrR family transcriptional regulator [Oceanicoccus sp.]|jgi:AcrR family transcriptional regulator
MGNRERIIEESLRLMNEYGTQSIGTTQVSESLGISPGNLYYHFKNKEEIVRALFERLEIEIRAVIAEDVVPPISTARFVNFYQRSMGVAWKYRFFFGGLLHLLRKDAELSQKYRDLQAWAVENLENISKQLVKDKNMRKPRGTNGYASLALNTWLIWSNWIRHIQISSPTHNIEKMDMVSGLIQIFDILSPYLDTEFERSARAVLSRNSVTKSKKDV